MKTTLRLPQLDFLRSVAVVLVLSHHMVYTSILPGRLEKLSGFLIRFGWTGLDLFFVLSGFLIGGLLFGEIRRTGHLRLGRFLIRRGFKIWPLYYGFLLLCTLLIAIRTGDGIVLVARSLWSCYLNVQNFDFEHLFEISHGGIFVAHVWTLAVEEHFYVFLPFLLTALVSRSKNARTGIESLPLVCLTVMACCLLARLWLFALLKASPFYTYQTQFRFDGLFAGVLLAYYWHYHQEKLHWMLSHPWMLLFGGFICLLPMTVLDHGQTFTDTWGYSLLYIGYGAILLAMMSSTKHEGTLQRFFSTRFARVVARVGAFSYPIYLFHMLCFACVDWFFKFELLQVPFALRWLLGWTACLGSSAAVGILVGVGIEKPVLALRNRFYPSS